MAKKINLRGKEEENTPKRAVFIFFDDGTCSYNFYDTKADAVDRIESIQKSGKTVAVAVEMSAHNFAMEYTRRHLEAVYEDYLASGAAPEEALDMILCELPKDVYALLTEDDIDDLIAILALMYADRNLLLKDGESEDDGEDEDKEETPGNHNTQIIDTEGQTIVVHNHGILNIYCNGER